MPNTRLIVRTAAIGVLAVLTACAGEDADQASPAPADTAPVGTSDDAGQRESVPVTDEIAAGGETTVPLDSVPITTLPPSTVVPVADSVQTVETLFPRAIGESTGPLPPLRPALAPVGPGPVEFTAFAKPFSITLSEPMNAAEGRDHVVLQSTDSETTMVFFVSDAFVNADADLHADRLDDPRSELQPESLMGLPIGAVDAWLSELDRERVVTLQLGSDILVGVAPRPFYSFVSSLPNIEAATGSPELAMVGLDDAVVQITGDRQYRMYELDDRDDAWYVLVNAPGVTERPSSPTTDVDNLLRTLDELFE